MSEPHRFDSLTIDDIEYPASQRWQALSFSALRAFETPDGRIALHGL